MFHFFILSFLSFLKVMCACGEGWLGQLRVIGYVLLATQNPYPMMVYSVASY